jgi:hypothetical protein
MRGRRLLLSVSSRRVRSATLNEIEQMASVGAHESFLGSATAPGFFQMPKEDSDLLSFSVYDILKRIRELRAAL